jgi:hypothetical protein
LEIFMSAGTLVVLVGAIAIGYTVPLPSALIRENAWGTTWIARAGVAAVVAFVGNYILNAIVNQVVRRVPATKASLWSFEWPPLPEPELTARFDELAELVHQAASVTQGLAERVSVIEDRLVRAAASELWIERDPHGEPPQS